MLPGLLSVAAMVFILAVAAIAISGVTFDSEDDE